MYVKTLFLAASALTVVGAIPVAHAIPATGLAGGISLFSFDTATPGIDSALRTISGLQGGETLYGIDYRPWIASAW